MNKKLEKFMKDLDEAIKIAWPSENELSLPYLEAAIIKYMVEKGIKIPAKAVMSYIEYKPYA